MGDVRNNRPVSFLKKLGDGLIQEEQLIRDRKTGKVYRFKKMIGVYFKWDRGLAKVKGRVIEITRKEVIDGYIEKYGPIPVVERVGK